MPTRVILDTDIGTDADDALALALILASPELKLEGVTVVYGDVLLRARIAHKLLTLRGAAEIPVQVGAGAPLNPLRPVFWAGHEGLGILGPEDEAYTPSPESAADFIVRTVMDNPGEIHLVGIAPLTNIGLAFQKEPRLAQNVAGVTLMGGAVRGPGNFHLPYWEHNIGADVDASQIVFTSGAPITLIPLDVTTQVFYTSALARKMRETGSAFHEAVATQIELYPYIRAYGSSHAHDPVAVATLIDPSFVTLEDVHIDIETQGRHTLGATLIRKPTPALPANARVALSVDARRVELFLVERLLK